MNKRANLSKILTLTLFLSGILLGLTRSAWAQGEMPDYEFYKKYGNHSKVWDENVQKGFEAYDKQNCDDTLNFLKQAIAAQAQDALVYYKVAVCSEVSGSPYTALQYYQLAEEQLQKLQTIHRYHKDIYESYGRALYQAKKYDQAFPYLTRAAAIGSPSFGLYYLVGTLYLQKNDSNAAIELFEKALSQDTSAVPPANLAAVYREVAKAYYKNKNIPKTTELITKAVQLNPQDQEASQLKAELAAMTQQQSMVQMLNNLTNEAKPLNYNSGSGPTSAPPPPAAAKLPPLDGSPIKDPTPALGTPVAPGSPGLAPAPMPPAPAPTTSAPPPSSSTSTTPSGSTKLQPLPPAP